MREPSEKKTAYGRPKVSQKASHCPGKPALCATGVEKEEKAPLVLLPQEGAAFLWYGVRTSYPGDYRRGGYLLKSYEQKLLLSAPLAEVFRQDPWIDLRILKKDSSAEGTPL